MIVRGGLLSLALGLALVCAALASAGGNLDLSRLPPALVGSAGGSSATGPAPLPDPTPRPNPARGPDLAVNSGPRALAPPVQAPSAPTSPSGTRAQPTANHLALQSVIGASRDLNHAAGGLSSLDSKRSRADRSIPVIVPLLLLLIALATLLYMYFPQLRSMLFRSQAQGVSEQRLSPELEAAVEHSLEDLRDADVEPRLAVMAAYAKMERSLAAHTEGRRSYETPFEFMARVLTQLQVSRVAVRQLTELFELARYSHHPIGPAMRTDAAAAAASILDQLRRAGQGAQPA